MDHYHQSEETLDLSPAGVRGRRPEETKGRVIKGAVNAGQTL